MTRASGHSISALVVGVRAVSKTQTHQRQVNLAHDLVPKGAQMGGRIFDCQIKSVSNTLSCCCFVCAFIIGQYHSGNNMSSKSGAAGEIFIFESEKRHGIRPLGENGHGHGECFRRFHSRT